MVLTVCDAPRITIPPLFHIICGDGLAPAELHEISVRAPEIRGWFNPCMITYRGGTVIYKVK